ncbi:hypothetical protein Tco_0422371, partial [Tanacetum coccineum]
MDPVTLCTTLPSTLRSLNRLIVSFLTEITCISDRLRTPSLVDIEQRSILRGIRSLPLTLIPYILLEATSVKFKEIHEDALLKLFDYQIKKDDQDMQQMLKRAKILKGTCLNGLSALKSNFTQKLEQGITKSEFERAFSHIFGEDVNTFTRTFSQNMDKLEQQLTKETILESNYQNAFRVLKIQECTVKEVKASNACSGDTDNSGIVSDKGNDQSLENQSNTSGDESNRSRNECNEKINFGDDTD